MAIRNQPKTFNPCSYTACMIAFVTNHSRKNNAPMLTSSFQNVKGNIALYH